MPRRLWSDEDISRLKGMAGQYPAEQIAKALGRGLEATYLKAPSSGFRSGRSRSKGACQRSIPAQQGWTFRNKRKVEQLLRRAGSYINH
jgi:hypothetical protein